MWKRIVKAVMLIFRRVLCYYCVKFHKESACKKFRIPNTDAIVYVCHDCQSCKEAPGIPTF